MPGAPGHSITPAGRHVVDQATTRRRALIAEILARLPAERQRAVAEALRSFAAAAGEIPDDQWPPSPPDEPPHPTLHEPGAVRASLQERP